MSKPWQDREKIIELYKNKGKTMVETSKELGCSQSTLGYWMDKLEIPRDNQSGPWRDKEKLEKEYVKNRKSIPMLAEEWGCSYGVISKWLNRHDIQSRSLGEAFVLAGERNIDVSYYIDNQGYPVFRVEHKGEYFQVHEHRLLAVAKYGFNAIQDKHVHHITPIEWLNYEENIELLTPEEHRKAHSNNSEHLNLQRQ